MQDGNMPGGTGNEPSQAFVTADSVRGLWHKRGFRLAASVVTAILATGIGLGVTSTIRGSVPAAERIPAPPAKNAVFVEDDDGAGADQQANIFQVSGAGLVRIQSARGASLGSGIVLTRSGFVLTTYRGLTGAGALIARFEISGKTYPARIVGSDLVANLALLQLSSGTFKPVAVGTVADIRPSDRVTSAGGNGNGIMLSNGGVIGINIPATIGGHWLTGLLEVTSLTQPGQEIGGPLFNLSGQVLGINIAVKPHSPQGDGYVVPIDGALRIARQIAGQ